MLCALFNTSGIQLTLLAILCVVYKSLSFYFLNLNKINLITQFNFFNSVFGRLLYSVTNKPLYMETDLKLFLGIALCGSVCHV